MQSMTAVALRKESVDRNRQTMRGIWIERLSLSARRAWIEMYTATMRTSISHQSLSARRAWIEIQTLKGRAKGKNSRSPQGERG